MINNLEDLIYNYGSPNVLMDNWNNSKGYAIWGFEDTILWDCSGLYLSGKLVKQEFKKVQDRINKWKKNSNEIASIGFINYNFKDILYPHLNFKSYSDKIPYLFFGKPKLIKEYKIETIKKNPLSSIKMTSDILSIESYRDIIFKIKNELENGNAYQINFTMLKKYTITHSPFQLYLDLRNFIKPKLGYYFKFKEYDILSFSPEQFFEKNGKNLYLYPMKGTIERHLNIKEDKKCKDILKKSIKDKAEHLMIVDLIRNDLGKISNFGSIKVDSLFNIESHDTVHQMVSCVNGIIRDGIQEFDIIRALFPGGSVTGAPKESAMTIIDSLENYSRNIYTGAIGYITNQGDMNFNIPIRTMTVQDNKGYYPVGGGIVWDSKVLSEWQEAQTKSKILSYIEK